jgi:hypothetical protein
MHNKIIIPKQFLQKFQTGGIASGYSLLGPKLKDYEIALPGNYFNSNLNSIGSNISLKPSALTTQGLPQLNNSFSLGKKAQRLANKQNRRNGQSGATKFSQENAQALNAIGAAGSQIASATKGFNETQSTINSGINSAISMIPGVGPLASAALGTFDAIGGALGAKIDTLDANDAARAGLSGANKANELLGALPGVGTVLGAFAGKTIQSNKSAEIDNLTNAYGSSTADIEAAQGMGGKRMLFGKGKANRFINEQNRVNKLLTDIGLENKLVKSNTMAENYVSQNQNRYSGATPQLLLAKSGIKFPKLEEAKQLLQSWTNKKESDLQRFKEGGKIQNVIVEGALHARKHDLESKNPKLEGNITKKGIPVISKSEGGEITQQAEIETGELVLNIDLTNKLEVLYKDGSDEAMIEAGKLLAKELIKNTKDKTKELL